MKITTCCLALLSLACTGLRAEVILDENFSESTPEGLPANATDVAPATPTDTLAVQILSDDDNTAGGGNNTGVRILDNDPKFAALEYNIVADADSQLSAVKISFSIALNAPAKEGAEGERATLYFGVGAYQQERVYLNSEAKRLVSASFSNDGKYSFRGGEAAKSKTATLAADKPQQFTVYLNGYNDTTLTVAAPDNSPLELPANTMTVYLDNKQLCSLDVDKFMDKENQIGRISFSTTAGGKGIDFTISALRVETIDDDLPQN